MSSECHQGCRQTLFCLLLAFLRRLHLISKSFYHKHCACDLKLEAISFNHDTSSLSADAMNLRKNFTQTITAPEWTVGKTSPTDSPAAYAIKETHGKKITIKVKFTVGSNNVTKAEVRAKGGGVLGALDPQVVNFAGGVSVPALVSFELHHHSIGAAGIKREDITWHWEYRCCGGSVWEPLQTTKHRIYVVLEEPKLASGLPVNRVETTRRPPSPRQSTLTWDSFTIMPAALRLTQPGVWWRCLSSPNS